LPNLAIPLVILLVLVRVKKEEKMGLSLFVNRRLEVQFLSPAPHQPSVDPAALRRFIELGPPDPHHQ
jgi:hypothetical protein